MKVNIIDNDLLSIQEARILAENAFEAVATGTGMSLNDVEKLKVYATTVNRR